MNHDEIIQLMLIEKYLLGELAPELQDQFEEHYFSCRECALDVRVGTLFVDTSKVILSEGPSPRNLVPVKGTTGTMWGWLRPAALAPALIALLVIIGYQNLVTYPRLKGDLASATTPDILPSVSLINVNTRGVERPQIVVRRGQPFLLFVDIPAETRFSSYTAELSGPDGNLEWSLPVSSDATRETVPIRVPSEHSAAGAHTLVIRGVESGHTSSEIGRYPFNLQFQR
jgi:Putative zinc-finger